MGRAAEGAGDAADGDGGLPRDRAAGRVTIEAGPETTLAQVAAEFDRLMHGMSAMVPGPWVPALLVGGHRVPGDIGLAGSPLLDGCVVSLGDPSGCLRPE